MFNHKFRDKFDKLAMEQKSQTNKSLPYVIEETMIRRNEGTLKSVNNCYHEVCCRLCYWMLITCTDSDRRSGFNWATVTTL